MLALITLVLLFVALKLARLPEWLAVIAAVAGGLAVRRYLPGIDIGMNRETIAVIIAGLATAPYWLGPVVIYGTHRTSASPAFEAYDGTRHAVPPSVAVALRESESALLAAGFRKVGDYFQTGFMQNMTSRVGLFENRASRQEAIVIGTYVNAEPVRLIAHHVEVLARFTHGRSLLVNNSPVIGAFAPIPGKTVEQFPGVRDPRRLVRLHERLLARMGTPEALREIDRGGDGAAYLRRAILRELDQQVTVGYLHLHLEQNAYRPTVKGATLMTWAQLPPWSMIRRARVRRRAADLITSLGVTEPDASPATVPALQRQIVWPAVAALLLVVGYAANAGTTSFRPAERVPTPQWTVVPAGFVIPQDFPGAVKALETLTGATAEQLVVIDSLGVSTKANGATVGVPAEQADRLLLVAQSLFLERGFFLFRHKPNYGIGGAPDEIGLVPLRDQFAVVQLVGTNGANFDLSTTDVVAWLRDLHRDAPFILTGIGYDHVEGRFLNPVGASADSLAKRLHGFCPDVVDQGTGSVRELANEIGRLNTFFCWWD